MRRNSKLVFVVTLAGLASLAAADFSRRPVTVSPGSASGETVVEGRCPTFHWGSQRTPERFELVVYRVGAGDGLTAPPVLKVDLPGSVSGWTPSLGQCLEPGKRYAWSVRADDGEGEAIWSAPRLFAIADRPALAEVEEALAVLERYREAQTSVRAAASDAPNTPGSAPLRTRESDTRGPRASALGPPPSAATPTASATPSITVTDQIHLGAASDIFKDGSVFLWDDASNMALGRLALSSNTTGFLNVAFGTNALRYNADGKWNTAVGGKALYKNTDGGLKHRRWL